MRVLSAMWVGLLLIAAGTAAAVGAVGPAAAQDARAASRTIVLTPASGAPGQALAVTGVGWSPAFGRVSVWLDSGSSAAPILLASATVDSRGMASGTGTVPRLGVGAHRVAACQSCIDGVTAERTCATGLRNADVGCATFLIVFLATRSDQVSGSPGSSAASLPSVEASAVATAPATGAAALPSPSWRPALTASALAVTAGIVVLLVGLLVARRRSPALPSVRVERVAGGEPAPVDVVEVPRRAGPALRVVVRADEPSAPTVTEVRR